ncbi:MAG: PKD domain-containing protein [Thermoplasmata archaeon]|nr:PKD domain-containing protein [Thermoplasmata archaeon]
MRGTAADFRRLGLGQGLGRRRRSPHGARHLQWLVVAAVLLSLLPVASGAAGAGPSARAVSPAPTTAAGPARTLSGPPTAPLPANPPTAATPHPSLSSTLIWSNITAESPTQPGPFWFTEGTWDGADHYLVTYGGDNFAGVNLQTTEAYLNGNWTTLATTGVNPGPLDGPSLAYDPAAREVIMYGGVASYSPFSSTNLTYVYAAGIWSAAHLNPTPPPRLAGSMVFDADLGGVVLFGGYNNSDHSGATLLNDLWLYKAGAWSLLASGGPSNRTWASLGYDPTLHELVLFGGLTPSGTCLGDTWSFNGTWTRVAVPGGGPTGFAGAAIGYDPSVGGLVLTAGGTGGASCPNVPNTATYTFNGTGWSVVPVLGSPGTHLFGVSAWDPTNGMFVVAGGDPNGTTTDVLAPPLSLDLLSAPSPLDLGVAAPFESVVTGGVPQRTTSWSWGDGTLNNTTGNASHAYGATGNFTVRFEASDPTGPAVYLNLSVQVFDGPTPQILGPPGALDTGINATFSGSSVGGYGLVVFHWDFGDGTQTTGSMVRHAFSGSGSVTVTLTATDIAGRTAAVNLSLQVFPALEVTAVVPARGEVGVPVSLVAETSGGDAPLTFAWVLDDGGTAGSGSFEHTFSTSANHTVHVSVLDGTGVYANRSATIDVASALLVSVQGPSSVSTGDTGTWTANVTGGEGPFTVTWTIPGVAAGTGLRATHDFSGAGNYVVSFTVSDALNASNSTSIPLTVSSPSAPFGGSVDGIPTWEVAGLVAAIAVAAGVLGYGIYRRGRSRSGTD